MVLQKNDWAWIRIRNNRRLGLVLAVREHVAVVRPLFKSRKQLQPYRETIALRLLEKANLSREEIAMLPCGKRILSVNKAFEIVAANRIFTDDPKRKERRVYYCARCRGFHTSSKVPVPWILFARLRSDPFEPELPIPTDNHLKHQVLVWLRDHIGVPISHALFDRSLLHYAPTYKEALDKLLIDPVAFIHFVYLHVYLKDRKNRRR